MDQLDGFLRVPDILQHYAGAEYNRHHQPIHKPGLVRHRRGHQNDIVGSEMQSFCIGDNIRHGGIRRMHHTFRLAGRARRVDQLRDVVRAGTMTCENLVRVRRVFPLRLAEQLLETIVARASHYDYVQQIRKARLETGDHLLMVEVTELFRHDDDLASAVLQHER